MSVFLSCLLFLLYTFGLVLAVPVTAPGAVPEPLTRLPRTDLSQLKERGDFSTSRNDLSGSCKAVTVIFARGTAELGNVGMIAGPPFFNALADLIGDENVAVQGVNYPATITGYLAGGDGGGASTMAGLVREALAKCPETQIVLGGYSQGAQLVHLSTSLLGTFPHISAVVLFGDPDNGKAISCLTPAANSADVMTICHDGDLICDGQPIVLPPHLTYSLDGGVAAGFVASRVFV